MDNKKHNPLSNLGKAIANPKKALDVFLFRHGKFIPDKTYLSLLYRLRFGRKLNWNKPKTFNEKLNWLKLYYRRPEFSDMADKYKAKQIVEEKIGKKYVVPCYGAWRRVDDIDFSALPEKFFLKSTHDSGGGIMVDKTKGVDLEAIKRRFNKKTLDDKNWFWPLREWAYKNITPRILAEEFLDEGTGHELHDYKFFCFNGVPTFMYITNKGAVITENFYDMDFKPVYIDHNFERSTPEYEKPANFKQMQQLASVLSEGLPFVRIDFTNVGGKLLFGEFTFYDWGGMRPFNNGWDEKLGDLIKLPKPYSS